MNKAIKYLESVSVPENDYGDNLIETVTISEAITACKLQELDTLQRIKEEKDSEAIINRMEELQKQLRNIKIK